MNFGFGKKINLIPHKLVESNTSELLKEPKGNNFKLEYDLI